MNDCYLVLFVQLRISFPQINLGWRDRALREVDAFLFHAFECRERNAAFAEGSDVLYRGDEFRFGFLRASVILEDFGDCLGHPVVHELLHVSAGFSEGF